MVVLTMACWLNNMRRSTTAGGCVPPPREMSGDHGRDLVSRACPRRRASAKLASSDPSETEPPAVAGRMAGDDR